MNENLNLVEILKDCPQGTKLYSVVHGEVEFEKNAYTIDYPIIYKYIDKDGCCCFGNVTKDGRFYLSVDGECTLFPSKQNRDWNTFKIEHKFDINTLQPFDKVLVRDDNTHNWKCDFYDSYVEELGSPFRTTYSWYKQCIPYNEETRHLVGKTMMPPKKYITWEE